MKKLLYLLFISILVACSAPGPKPIYQEGTAPYVFFQTLADSLNLNILNPEKATTLVTAKGIRITTFDIMPSIYMQFQRYGSQPSSIPVDQIKATIEHIAGMRGNHDLLVLEAKANQVAVEDSLVDFEMNRIFSSRGGQEKFEQFIVSQGLTMDYVRGDVAKSMLSNKFLNEFVGSKIEVSELDLQEAYDRDKTATVRHILFMTQGKTEAEVAEIKNKAEAVLARAKSGEDFASLAKEFSEDPGSKDKGGIYEDFPRGEMVKPFDEASFTLPIGSISDLVETSYGFHIIQIVDRKKETLPFEEVKARLEKDVMQQKRDQAYYNLLDELKVKYDYQEHFDVIG